MGAGDDRPERNTKSRTQGGNKYEPHTSDPGRTIYQACSLCKRAQGDTRGSLPSMGARVDQLEDPLSTNSEIDRPHRSSGQYVPEYSCRVPADALVVQGPDRGLDHPLICVYTRSSLSHRPL